MISALGTLLAGWLGQQSADRALSRTESSRALQDAFIRKGIKDSEGAGQASTDRLQLSNSLRSLMDCGLDLESSGVREGIEQLSFQFAFEDQEIQRLTSSGTYDLHSQHLSLDLSFQAALSVHDAESGTDRQELFQFNLHLDAAHIELSEGTERVEKEDILQFARKILNKISKLHAEGKDVEGISFEDEDLKDLGSVDNGRLLKGIMLIMSVLRQLHQANGKQGEPVWLHPEREKALVQESQQMESQSLQMSLDVRRIAVESTTGAPA